MDEVVSFKIDDETYWKIHRLAVYYGVSVSEIVRRAIKNFLESKNRNVVKV